MKESSDGKTLMVYGSRFGEQQRRKHNVHVTFYPENVQDRLARGTERTIG